MDAQDDSTDGEGSADLYDAQENLEACKLLCEKAETCEGVEYHFSGRCELWTHPINAVANRSGYECLRVRREALIAYCDSLECPQGYTPKSNAAYRHCNGTICDVETDLNTCCTEVRCSLPADVSGYNVSACNSSSRLPERLCQVSCEPFFGTLEAPSRPSRTCELSGRNFSFSGCNHDLHACAGRIALAMLNDIVHLVPFTQTSVACSSLDGNYFFGDVELICYPNATVSADTSGCTRWSGVLQDVHTSGQAIEGSLFIHDAIGAADRAIREFRAYWAASGPRGPCQDLLGPSLGSAVVNASGVQTTPLEIVLRREVRHAGATHIVVLAVDEVGRELADVCATLELSKVDLEVIPADPHLRTVRASEPFQVQVRGTNLPSTRNLGFFLGLSSCRSWGPNDINWNMQISEGPKPAVSSGASRWQAVLMLPGDYRVCLPVSGGPGARLQYVDLGLTVRVSNDTYYTPLLSAGYQHTCMGLGSSKVKCWGDGTHGQLGLGFGSKRGDNVGEMGDALPFLDFGTNALELSAGSRYTCILLSTHRIKCWGQASRGQLGYENTVNLGDDEREMGDQLPDVNLGTNLSVVHVSAGDVHTCAVFDNGGLKCWGLGHAGRTGLEETRKRGDEPGEMGDALPYVNVGRDRTVEEVTTGFLHTCAVLDGGRLKCWGNSAYGQLGLEDTQSRGDDPGEMGDALPFVNVCSGCSVAYVGAGEVHTCALMDNHKVKCWGRGASGRLGYGDLQNRGDNPGEMGDALPYVDFGTGRTVLQLFVGFAHNCVLLDNKGVKCWGYGYQGQLGYGDRRPRGNSAGEMGDNLPYVDLGTGRTALYMSLGEFHTCAYLDNGRVKCWGANHDGELGYQDRTARGVEPGQMGDSLQYVDLGVIFFDSDFVQANCTMGLPCAVALRGRTGMDSRGRLLLGSQSAGCNVIFPTGMGDLWRTTAPAQCSTPSEDGDCIFDFKLPVKLLPSTQGLPLCFWQSSDLPNTARHEVGRMTFVGPFNTQGSPLTCFRGQICQLKLKGGTVPGYDWPPSRVLVGTGNCRNLSLAHIFPSNSILPGVSSWARRVRAANYIYTYPRTGPAEPQRYSICWCAKRKDGDCERRVDFSVWASDFLLTGPFTPTKRHHCWRSRNCTAAANGTHLTKSDGLRMCGDQWHFSPDGDVMPTELVLRTDIETESVRMTATIVGPILGEVGQYSICWCPARKCSNGGHGKAKDFGATFALLEVFGPRREANLDHSCHVGSPCPIHLLGSGNASTLVVSGIVIKAIQPGQATNFACIGGDVLGGPVFAERSDGWPLTYELDLPADESLLGRQFAICWCGLPVEEAEGPGGPTGACASPHDFSAEAGTLQVTEPICTGTDAWAPNGSATCAQCKEFHSAFNGACSFDYVYFMWAMSSMACIFLAFFVPCRRIGLRIRIVDMSIQNEKLVITTLGQHSIIVWRGRGESTEVTLSGTGNPKFDTPGARFRVRVVDSERLELLEEDGETPVNSGESSMGKLAQPWGLDILNTGLFFPMAGIILPVPLLAMAYSVWFLQQLRQTAMIGSGILGVLIAISAAFWERRRYHLLPSVLQKRYRQFRRQLLRETVSKDMPSSPLPRRSRFSRTYSPTVTRVERGPDRAVSAGQLYDFLTFFKDLIKFRDMYYINECITKPLTAPFRASFAELAGPSRVEYFVSHFWGTAFQHFVDSIKKHAESELGDDWRKVRYWICSFSNNQWEVSQELGNGKWEDSSFYKALKCDNCKGTCMVLDSQALPLTRSWCLFEVLQTYLRVGDGDGSYRGLLFCTSTGVLNSGSAGYDVAVSLARRLSQLRVQDATASQESDKLMIDGLLAKTGFERINRFVRKHIMRTLESVKRQFEADVDELNETLDETEASDCQQTTDITKMGKTRSTFRPARSSTWKLRADRSLPVERTRTNGSESPGATRQSSRRRTPTPSSPASGAEFEDEIRRSIKTGLSSSVRDFVDHELAESHAASQRRVRMSSGIGCLLPLVLSRRLMRCTSGQSGNSHCQDDRDSEKSCVSPSHNFVVETKVAIED